MLFYPLEVLEPMPQRYWDDYTYSCRFVLLLLPSFLSGFPKHFQVRKVDNVLYLNSRTIFHRICYFLHWSIGLLRQTSSCLFNKWQHIGILNDWGKASSSAEKACVRRGMLNFLLGSCIPVLPASKGTNKNQILDSHKLVFCFWRCHSCPGCPYPIMSLHSFKLVMRVWLSYLPLFQLQTKHLHLDNL